MMNNFPKMGGPAFPVSTNISEDKKGYGHQDGPNTWQFSGMTLFDYFAAHAPIDVSDANNTFYKENGRNAGTGEMIEMLVELRMRYAALMVKKVGA